MAIPYPYNRLGINAGGTVTPIEPIEGSQGVFMYDSHGSIVSSAMQMLNKTLYNYSASVWNSGIFISPSIYSWQSVACFSGGTVINPILYNRGILSVYGGTAKRVSVYYNNVGDVYSAGIYVYSNGFIDSANLNGYRTYLIVNSGEAKDVVLSAYSNNITVGNYGRLLNLSIVNDYRDNNGRGSNGPCYIYVLNNGYISGLYRQPASPERVNYVTADIRGKSNVNLLDLNVGNLGVFSINSFVVNNKITGTNELGSFWLSNNTLHNFVIKSEHDFSFNNVNDVGYINSLLINSGADFIFSSPDITGLNITKRSSARIAYPYQWNSNFNFSGVTDEWDSFGYSNGFGNNIVFGYYQSVTLYGGTIIEPYLSNVSVYLNKGTFISPFMGTSGNPGIWLEDGGVIISNNTNNTRLNVTYGFIDGGFSTITTTIDSSTVIFNSPYFSFTANDLVLKERNAIVISDSNATILNLTQSSGGIIDIRKPLCAYSVGSRYYSNYITMAGVHSGSPFNLSNGTFINPAVYAYGVQRPVISLMSGGAVLGGNVYSVAPWNSRNGAGILVGNSGYASGVTIHPCGIIAADIASNGAAPTITDITQLSGGNVYPRGYYVANYDSSHSSNGIWPIINGSNEFGSFYVSNGTMHNWAWYCASNTLYYSLSSSVSTYQYALSFYNNINTFYAMDTMHLVGLGMCSIYCEGNNNNDISFTNFNINNLHLSKGAVLSVSANGDRRGLIINDISVNDYATILGSYGATSAGGTYSSISIHILDYASNVYEYYNTVNCYGDIVFDSIHIGENKNVLFSRVTCGDMIIDSMGAAYLPYACNISYINQKLNGYVIVNNMDGLNARQTIKGVNQRGSFLVSGTYASNIMFDYPPNRLSVRWTSAACNNMHLMDVLVSNSNRLYPYTSVSLINCSVYGGYLHISNYPDNYINYLHINDGGICSVSGFSNLSNVNISSGLLYLYTSAAASGVTINSGGTCFLQYYNTVHDASINSDASLLIGGTLTSNYGTNIQYIEGRYNRAFNVVIQFGGTMVAGYNCTVSGVRVNMGGYLVVSSAGSALNVISNGGANIISMNGAYITYAS